MENPIPVLLAVGAGIAIGALAVWLYLRGQITSSFERGRSESAAELATSNEKARASEVALAKLHSTYEALQAQATSWRDALDQAKDDLSKLSERASRIPLLERKLGELEAASVEAGKKDAELRELSARLLAELKAERDVLSQLRNDLQAEKSQREAAEVKVGKLNTELAQLNAKFAAEGKQAEEKLALLAEAKEALSAQFKSLANDILEEKAKRFTEQNKINLGQILDPLRDRIAEFKAKVEEIHGKDSEQHTRLTIELEQLKVLNRQITEEAHGLAVALKGQAKKQGNWGELILGNVLDRSGLREGKDFRREVSFKTEGGEKRPDVIVYLPQSKHLVIDAKVSLNAYTRYVNSDNDVEREQALREHVEAMASRIEELSDRTYFELPGLNTPEMVFMFVPIESAFVDALRADESLFQKAIEQNVLVATPTTLLTSLNIVRQLWRFEEQNAHTAELADRAAKVYRKLVTFLGSMDAVGRQLDRAKESFGTAMGQLYSGKGNLISQAKEFERLGVSVQASLPDELVAKAELELEQLPEPSDPNGAKSLSQ